MHENRFATTSPPTRPLSNLATRRALPGSSRRPALSTPRSARTWAVAALALTVNCQSTPTQPAPLPAGPDTAAALAPSPPVAEQLRQAVESKGSDYAPRTRHLNPRGAAKYVNRLLVEPSPYLQQHAHNPVQWFAWGPEAFALAQRLQRPIFLSIGYSTCHWCHVMEEESFEDEEIAKVLNTQYIPIKVDREERPDIDAIYMAAVQKLTGRGGWPMSVWLTSDKLPFFGGTYFPARTGDRGMSPGFLELLQHQAQQYRDNPAAVGTKAQRLTEYIADTAEPALNPANTVAVVERAIAAAHRGYDEKHGGFRRAPKFPSSFPLRLLLRDNNAPTAQLSRTMAVHTLEQMAAGGLYDAVGGGFHRYSTDARWLVPHFEKMLYDNAQLAVIYLEAYQATANPEFAAVARETLEYILRDMTAPEGAFLTATDADSLGQAGEREEGYYYTWTRKELDDALTPQQARLVAEHYQVTPEGNFEGRSILHARHTRRRAAADAGLGLSEFEARRKGAMDTLRAVRGTRPAPLRDEKVQTNLNGLMIGALATASRVLDEPRYRNAAIRAADFLIGEMRQGQSLRHSYIDGQRSPVVFLQDFTFLASGLLDLFEASAAPQYLTAALELMEHVEQHFVDQPVGGYFSTPAGQDADLLVRKKVHFDSALPSGNSYALLNHLRLHALTIDEIWAQRAERTLAWMGAAIESNPLGHAEWLRALQLTLSTQQQVALIEPEANAGASSPLHRVLATAFAPGTVRVVATASQLRDPRFNAMPWARHKPARNGLPTAYVCELGRCKLPTNDPEVFKAQLAPMR